MQEILCNFYNNREIESVKMVAHIGSGPMIAKKDESNRMLLKVDDLSLESAVSASGKDFVGSLSKTQLCTFEDASIFPSPWPKTEVNFIKQSDGGYLNKIFAELMIEVVNQKYSEKNIPAHTDIRMGCLTKDNTYFIAYPHNDKKLPHSYLQGKSFWNKIFKEANKWGIKYHKSSGHLTFSSGFDAKKIKSLSELRNYIFDGDYKEHLDTLAAEFLDDLGLNYSCNPHEDYGDMSLTIELPDYLPRIKHYATVDELVKSFDDDPDFKTKKLSVIPDEQSASRFKLLIPFQSFKPRYFEHYLTKIHQFFKLKEELYKADIEETAKIWQRALQLNVMAQKHEDDGVVYTVYFPQNNGQILSSDLDKDPRDILKNVLNEVDYNYTTIDCVYADNGMPALNITAPLSDAIVFNPAIIGDTFKKNCKNNFIDFEINSENQRIERFTSPKNISKNLKLLRLLNKAFVGTTEKPEIVEEMDQILFTGKWSLTLQGNYEASDLHNDIIQQITVNEPEIEPDNVKNYLTVHYIEDSASTQVNIDPNIILDNKEMAWALARRFSQSVETAVTKNRALTKSAIKEKFKTLQKSVKKLGATASINKSMSDEAVVTLDFKANTNDVFKLIKYNLDKALVNYTAHTMFEESDDGFELGALLTETEDKVDSNKLIRFPSAWLLDDTLIDEDNNLDVFLKARQQINILAEDRGVIFKTKNHALFPKYIETKSKLSFKKKEPEYEIIKALIEEMGL